MGRELRPGGMAVGNGSNGSPRGGDGTAAGVVGRRPRGLFNGRAMAGALLIAVAAMAVFSVVAASAGHHTKQYVVATRTLAEGTIIGPGDLTTASVQLPSGTSAEAFRQAAPVIGRSVLVTVAPGELIESSMLSGPASTPTLRPVTVPVDPDSVTRLTPGDRVDVLATATAGLGAGSSGAVSVVARGASLISVSQSNPGLLSGSTSATLATIGVSNLAEVEAVVGAAHAGTVVLVQAEPSDGVGPGPAATPPTT
jgi:Flp pilus assembly protein CpaB